MPKTALILLQSHRSSADSHLRRWRTKSCLLWQQIWWLLPVWLTRSSDSAVVGSMTQLSVSLQTDNWRWKEKEKVSTPFGKPLSITCSYIVVMLQSFDTAYPPLQIVPTANHCLSTTSSSWLYLPHWNPYSSPQTLFFNHRSLDLTLSDLSKSEPTVSPDKPMGQLWAASSSVFEAQSLTNSEKSSGIVWKICPREVPRVIRLSLGTAPLGKFWLPSGPPLGKFFQTTHLDFLLFVPKPPNLSTYLVSSQTQCLWFETVDTNCPSEFLQEI